MKEKRLPALLGLMLAIALLCGCGSVAGQETVSAPAGQSAAVEVEEAAEAGTGASAETASAQADASGTAASAAAGAAEPDSGVLRFTQESTVKKDTFEGVADFDAFLAAAEKAFRIPGLAQYVIPQGIGYSETLNRVFISGYFKAPTLPSVLLAVDASTGESVAEYTLYEEDGEVFSSHVGGVAVSGTTLYVSAEKDEEGSFRIAAIPLEELSGTGSRKITITRYIRMAVQPSFMNVSEGWLWVGNFYYPKDGYELSPELNFTTASADGDYGSYILGFDLEREEELWNTADGYPLPDRILAAPDRIQGFTALSDGSVLLSQSYGRKNNSTLLRYAPDLSGTETVISLGGREIPCRILDSTCLTGTMTAMPMTEGLCPDGQGRVLVLFESGADNYSDGRYRTDCVWRLKP